MGGEGEVEVSEEGGEIVRGKKRSTTPATLVMVMGMLNYMNNKRKSTTHFDFRGGGPGDL